MINSIKFVKSELNQIFNKFLNFNLKFKVGVHLVFHLQEEEDKLKRISVIALKELEKRLQFKSSET